MKVVFLYTELADYFLKCCEALSAKAEVHVVRWPVNKEAPFNFKYSNALKIYNKEDYNLNELVQLIDQIAPQVLVCSGWIDKDYLHISKRYFKKIPTVLTCDTHWRGDLRQFAAVILSRFYLLNRFSHAWVPGIPQTTYVKKLGFKKEHIHTGFYSCDLPKFNLIYEQNVESKKHHFPKRFLYVGRYYEFKGIKELWKAFIELQEEEPNDWELWCLGTGDLSPVKHKKIKHFGFVQPSDLEPLLSQSGVFVLPSRFEPWGVVAHEYAAAGFPLLLSEAVGAGEAFLMEGKNGYSFPPNNTTALKNVLKKIINLSGKELILMSEQGHAMAQSISPEKWRNTVLKIYDERKK